MTERGRSRLQRATGVLASDLQGAGMGIVIASAIQLTWGWSWELLMLGGVAMLAGMGLEMVLEFIEAANEVSSP